MTDIKTDALPEEVERAWIEQAAQEVYEAMRWAAEHAENGNPPEWHPYGNSTAQSQARQAAKAIKSLTTKPVGADVERLREAGAKLRKVGDDKLATRREWADACREWDAALKGDTVL